MRITIATDAWRPQVNGVVRTLGHTVDHLRALGHEVRLVTPQDFRTYPCPTYPSIRLALFPKPGVKRALEEFRPHAIHIATEGPIGHVARALCRKRSLPFTTSYHTQFPEYVRARCPIPVDWSYAYLRRFHGRAVRTMIATESMRSLLRERGFRNLAIWAWGVDSDLFQPGPKSLLPDPRPISMYMGRVAVEKTSKRSYNSICPAPSMWWGMVLIWSRCVAGIQPSGLRGGNQDRSWRHTLRLPTCSFFPASPIRSA